MTPVDVALRPAADDDVDRLHALFCMPDVYRYLADGEAPDRSITELWLERSHADFAASGVGMWVLEDREGNLVGCVRLEAQPGCTAELIYALAPQFWGAGLATRMSWTVMQHAFAGGHFDRIVAGADGPNAASIAVMRRLGMKFLRTVTYPLGEGVEYVFHRGDPPPTPLPSPIALESARSSGRGSTT